MSYGPLSRLDDWLIDSVFQRVCDWIRLNIGWSKKVPAAVFFLTAAASLIPYFLWHPEVIEIPPALLALVFSTYQASRLFEKELRGDEEQTRAMSIDRLKQMWARKFGLIVLPIFSVAYLSISLIEGTPIPLHSRSFLMWLTSDLCALYFLACTDRPKRQEKKVVLV